MDDIQRLMAESGCSEEQARLTLSATKGDYDKALRVASSLAKTLMVAKGRFRGGNTGMQGLFSIVFNLKEQRVERILVVASGDPQAFLRADVNMKWRQFEDIIFTGRLSSAVAQQTTQDLQKFLQDRLRGDLSRTLFDYANENTLYQLKDVFADEIGKSIADGSVNIEIKLERISAFEFKGAEAEKRKKVEEKQPEPETEPAAETPDLSAPLMGEQAEAGLMEQTVKVNPVLAPVSGQPAGQLAPGDIVYVKFENQQTLSRVRRYFPDGNPPPLREAVPMEVTLVKPGDFEKVMVTGRIKTSLFGAATVSSELKVKMLLRDGKGAKAAPAGAAISAPAKGISWFKNIYFLPIAGGVFVFLILLALLWIYSL